MGIVTGGMRWLVNWQSIYNIYNIIFAGQKVNVLFVVLLLGVFIIQLLLILEIRVQSCIYSGVAAVSMICQVRGKIRAMCSRQSRMR
jgi:hypothetical protein